MKATALLLCCALVGCGHMAPQTVTVNVPVPVECREPEPARPAMPTDVLAPGATLDLFTKSAQAEIEIRDAYERQLVSALRACTQPLEEKKNGGAR